MPEKERMVRFPVRMSSEVDEIIRRAAFATGKSKNQYFLDAVIERAKVDAGRVQIKGEIKD